MLTKRGINPQLAKDAEKVIGELLPAEIVDEEAFREFKRLDAHPILHEKRHITLSNGRVVSLGTATHHLKRFIENLPEEEQKSVLAQRRMWNVIQCKRNAVMQRAYGTTVDGKGRITPKADKFILVKNEMIELFGRMFTAREVHELVVKQFEIPCTLLAVMNFRDRNINEINARIEEHKRTYSDIRLGYKRSRLEELTWLYITRKRIYEATKKGDDHRLLLMTLEQLRKEIEGDRLTMDGTLNTNIELTVQEHINKELFSNFPLKEIILARVAARAKIEVTALLLEINKSYYYQFLHPTTEAEATQPAFPSTQTYDFDRIRYMHQQQATQKQLTAAPVTVINPEQLSTATSVKEALLAKLKNKSQHINFNKEKLAGKFIDRSNETEKEA